ncbi:MAG TPA: PKD domain-containing protein [Ferruginibacter sp.]|nr:PKD domain-containing protein [Ferruginibacter sp.]HRQ19773.1 PKD domain-containing protein [Ferruginibacter sp.]
MVKSLTYYLLVCSGLFLCISSTYAQNLSNKGKEFWVGYGHHQFMEVGQSNGQEMVLYFSAEQAANVRVTIKNTTYIRDYSVPANSVIISELIPKSGANDARLITLPCSFVPPGFPCGGEGIFPRHGIHIESDVPIVAYAHIYGSASSGATMLMPVETWGYSYITLNSKQNYASNCFSWFYVVASEDNTLVEITPAATTRTGYHIAGVPYTVTLNKGEIYQTMAGPEGGNPKNEMTGTRVRSIANASGNCYPIAVFSGSSRTYNTPVACGASSGGDNDNQQCFPEQAWGKRYLTAPTSASTTASTFQFNTYKIIVKDLATQVRRNGTLLTGMNPAGYYEFNSNQAEYITADQPIMVAQFIHGGTGCMVSGDGDPEMMYISPVEQGTKRIGFYRNNEENITVNYLTLIIPNGGVSSLRINGSATFDHTYTHPRDPNYTVVVKRWAAAKAQAIAESDSAFTAITYGLGSVESYGYNAGTLINNLAGIGDIRNVLDPTSPSHPFTCTNTPFELSVLVGYQPDRMVWKLSQLAGILTPSVDVVDNAPVSTGTVVLNGITYYKYTLPGTYMFLQEGNHTVKIDNTHPSIDNCNNTEEIRFVLEVRGKPIAAFTTSSSGCGLDPVSFNAPDTSQQGYDLFVYNWDFGSGSTASGQTATHTFTTSGTYPVNLEYIATNGCVADTTMDVSVGSPPTSAFTASDVLICEGEDVTFTDNSSFTGAAPIDSWYWDFGDGTTLNAPDGNPVTHTYTTFGTFTVKFAVGVGATCPGDTATRTITVRAKPIVDMGYPNGCLPADGIINFTNESTVPDGRAMTGFSWDFGDPAATPPGNPNTSTQENPSHTYASFGTYTISLTVTTVDGCTATLTESPTFNLKPTFSYPAFTPVCEADAPFSVANATVTNGVPGTGVYQGPGTNAAGLFDPAAAGFGTHDIKYIYTTNAGCVDSVLSNITVRANPVVDFDIASGTCLPASGQVQFVNNTTIADGQTLTWLWDFDDPNATGGNPNTSTAQAPTHNYQDGTYGIKLTATTNNGCVSETTITKTLSVTPALSFPAIADQCENITTPVSIATATVTNSVPGSGVYSGPGTTSAGMFNPSVAGAGTHTITYDFTSTSGCTATITSTVLVRAKPVVDFTDNVTGCLGPNGTVNFTNNSTIGDGQTLTYAWDFDDPNATGGNPNTSTVLNPSHNFQEGTYNVKLTVTTNNGCVEEFTNTFTYGVTPVINFPALTGDCENVSTPLSIDVATITNGVAGTGVYSGPGTTAAGLFTPSDAGFGTHTITYDFTSAGGCTASASQTIQVRAKPTVDFTDNVTGCLGPNGTVNFTNSSTIADGQTLTYAWDFDDPNATGGNPNTSTAQNPSHNFGEGTYDVKLTVTTNNGCTDEKISTFTYGVTPVINFPALTSECANISTPVSLDVATITNGVTGTGVYSGPGTTAAGLFTPTDAGFGTHTITYDFTSAGGCTASASQTIQVRAKPTVDFTDNASGCLGTNGAVTFSNATTIADGQTLTYAWEFDDPNADASNPNTSTLQNPSHNFGEGTYDIKLTATTNTGCVDEKIISRTYGVTPALNFTALTAQCADVSDPVSVATATVTNGVTGSGVYSGPGTSADGMFTPSVAGAGSHTITYTFTSTGGCVATITQSIRVNPKPVAAFNATPDVCLGGNTTLSSTSTIPSGTIQTWNWILGDGTSDSRNSGATFSHTYTDFGSYTVKLVTVSALGCVSDTAFRTVNVHAIPEPGFTPPPFICMPGGVAAFVNNSSAPDGASLTYQWNFGDGSATSTALNPTHVYGSTGPFDVTLRATSGFGCVATETQTLSVFYDQPIAAFDVTPDNLCQGNENVFTDNSTAPGSTISNWLWNFGDGTTSDQQNPVKVYRNAGNYTVTLTVENEFGCASEPATANVTVNFQPIIDTGPSFAVPLGATIQLNPTANDFSVTSFLWTPPGDITDPAVFNPRFIARQNMTYILTATAVGGCSATDSLTVLVQRGIVIPNAISPNGDGINDRWVIKHIEDYPNAVVQVFNRYGQKLFESKGYPQPWDGTYKGSPLPLATYYYVIDVKNGFDVFTGSITILK